MRGSRRLEQGAFSRCKSLASITFPSTLTEVGEFAFKLCDSLREVVMLFGEKLPKIRCNTFHRCHLLESFKFPSLSTRMEAIIHAGQREIENKMDETRGVVEKSKDGELFVSVVSLRGDSWSAIKASLDRIVALIVYYELKEATTMFELALWKAKIDQADESDPVDRDACRIGVPGQVKDAILKYLRR